MHPTEAQGLIESAPCDCLVVEENERAHEIVSTLRQGGLGARIEERAIVLPDPLPDRSVHLESVGEEKIALMKAIREYAGVGLADAKEMAESAPCLLVRRLEGGRAAAFVDALTKAGAIAKLVTPS